MSSRLVTVISAETAWVPSSLRWAQEFEDAIVNVFGERQREIEAWMKSNAPWKDITGAARASLYTNVIRNFAEVVLEMRYPRSITYAGYLEYDHAGKFSILGPTQDYWFPILLEDLKRLVSP